MVIARRPADAHCFSHAIGYRIWAGESVRVEKGPAVLKGRPPPIRLDSELRR